MTESIAIMSNVLENKLINHVLRNTPYYTSGSIYVSLYLENPGEGNSGSEVTESNYARISLASMGTTGSPFVVSGSLAYNSGSVTFAKASGSWGTITHFGLMSASQSGSLLFYGSLGSGSGLVEGGDIVRFAPGKMVLYSTGAISASLSGSILNFILNNASYPTPGSSLYGGLIILVSSGNQYTEITGSTLGYSRIPIGGSNLWVSPVDGSTVLSSSLVFTTSASANWGDIHKVGIYSASAGGELLFSGSVNPYKRVYQYDGFYLPSGALTLSLDYTPPLTA